MILHAATATRPGLGLLVCLLLPVTLLARPALAGDQFSILSGQFFGRPGAETQPMVAMQARARAEDLSITAARAAPSLEEEMAREQGRLASLFNDRAGNSFFRKLPPKVRNDVASRLMTLIAGAEAGRAQYDAVQYAAVIKPPKKPTQMTIGEIYTWIDNTPGQQHAIGRYQFIPATLRRLVRHVGAARGDRFTPALQDQLAHQLLEEAGLSRAIAREMPRHDFMHNLSKIWAGLPTRSGKSYYHGLAGNKAVIGWAAFDAEMAKLFPS